MQNINKQGWRYDKKNYKIPKEIVFCKRCVNSNQRPRITFNEKGICSACQFTDYKNHEIDWDKRKKELEKVCDLYRKNDGSYDVIVPSSGGKDSAFVGHYLKNEFGMNPLTVTWSPQEFTQIGFENFQNHIKIGNLANILCTPPGNIHRKLTSLGMKVLGDPFLPFIYGMHNVPFLISEKFKIPLIMYGENSEVEYGGLKESKYNPANSRLKGEKHEKIYFSGIGPNELINHGIKEEELYFYNRPNLKKGDIEPKSLYMGYFHKWNPQENYYYCVENTGFKPNKIRSEGTYTRFASLDDKLDGFHYYLMFIKFGFGRATSDAAHEIREGHITREEGVQLVRKYDGEFPEKHFQLFLEYCDMSQSEFHEIVDSWRAKHVWEKKGNDWKLKNQAK
jgi:N-acetyl sugar amidotransferase